MKKRWILGSILAVGLALAAIAGAAVPDATEEETETVVTDPDTIKTHWLDANGTTGYEEYTVHEDTTEASSDGAGYDLDE